MKLSNFIEGLTILRPYYVKQDGFHIGAEHDQFFAYATDNPLSDGDVAKMRELGWFQPDTVDDITYDPENGWIAFT
jgi:hypothetical protein